MAATGKWYGKAFLSVLNKEVDWDTDTIKVMFCTSSYTPDQDTHQYKSSVTNEHANTGTYAAGGVTLGTVTISYTAGTNTIMMDAADTTVTGATFVNLRYLVIYDSSPATDATRPLLGYVDLGSAQTFTGDLTMQWDAAGIFTIVVS